MIKMALLDYSKKIDETYSKNNNANDKDSLKVTEVDDKIVSIEVKNTYFKIKLVVIVLILLIICGGLLYFKLR